METHKNWDLTLTLNSLEFPSYKGSCFHSSLIGIETIVAIEPATYDKEFLKISMLY